MRPTAARAATSTEAGERSCEFTFTRNERSTLDAAGHARLTAELGRLRAERVQVEEKLTGLASNPESENRSQGLDRLESNLRTIDGQINAGEEQVAEHDREERTRTEAARADRRTAENAARRELMHATDTNTGEGRVRVTSEPLTYERGGQQSYLRDLYVASKTGDLAARQRLERHQQEVRVENRALNSTDGQGGDFVPPIWLMDEWVNVARASRPFAGVVRTLPLPPNTDSINVPKVLTGSSTAIQTADNATVSATDATTGSVSIPVRTIAGNADVSRQFFDRALPAADEILFADLVADYNRQLDMQLLSGSGAAGQIKGVLSDSNRLTITYTDTSSTVAELYSRIADAVQQIHGQVLASPTHIVMHPRRWSWIVAQTDTTGRPLVSPVAAMNAPGTFGVTAEGVVGTLQGLQVVIDANLPTTLGAGTNEDTILVTRAEENILFELPVPQVKVFEEILSSTLGVRLQLYSYAAFSTERRSKANAQISGTGLTSPAFV